MKLVFKVFIWVVLLPLVLVLGLYGVGLFIDGITVLKEIQH